eukprot:20172-Prymnesium_polylepis.2
MAARRAPERYGRVCSRVPPGLCAGPHSSHAHAKRVHGRRGACAVAALLHRQAPRDSGRPTRWRGGVRVAGEGAAREPEARPCSPLLPIVVPRVCVCVACKRARDARPGAAGDCAVAQSRRCAAARAPRVGSEGTSEGPSEDISTGNGPTAAAALETAAAWEAPSVSSAADAPHETSSAPDGAAPCVASSTAAAAAASARAAPSVSAIGARRL